MGRIAGVTPEETKERLIDAAARVFELKGFEGATVAQIASEAGVTSGAIYTHYSSKAELLVDALRVHGERATSSMFPPGKRVGVVEMLTALATRLGNRNRSDTALLTEALLASRRDPELAQVLADALVERQAFTTAVVAKGQAEGVLTDEVSPEAAARFALMLGLGSLLVSDLDIPPVDSTEWATFVHRLVNAFTEEIPS